MKKILLAVGTGIVLFLATVFGLLAAQGRLNHEGTQGIPVVSMLFPAPPAPPEGESGTVDDEGAAGTDGAEGDEKMAADAGGEAVPYILPGEGGKGQGGDAGGTAVLRVDDSAGAEAGTDPRDAVARRFEDLRWRDKTRPGKYFAFPRASSALSVEDIDRILAAARQRQEEVERRSSALDDREANLDAREKDISDRQTSLLDQMREIQDLRAQLEKDIRQFRDEVMLIRTDEIEGLKGMAKSVAAMEPARAKDLILNYWQTQDGQQRIIKVWRYMPQGNRVEILNLLEVQAIRDILDRATQVVEEPAAPR